MAAAVILRGLASLVTAFAALIALPAAAQSGRPVLEQRAAYGPVTACIGDYALDVRAGEAVSTYVDVQENVQSLRLLNDASAQLSLSLGPPKGLQADMPSKKRPFTLPSGIAAQRADFPDWKGYRAGIPGEAVYDEIAAHHVYLLPDAKGVTQVTASALVFRGRSKDGALLSRIRRRADAACTAIAPPEARGSVPSAAAWRPAVIDGPKTYCSTGGRIAIPAGATLQQQWRYSPGDPGQFVMKHGGKFFHFGLYWLSDRAPPKASLGQLGFRLDQYLPTYASFLAPDPMRHDPNAQYQLFMNHSSASREELEAVVEMLSFVGKRTEGCDIVVP